MRPTPPAEITGATSRKNDGCPEEEDLEVEEPEPSRVSNWTLGEPAQSRCPNCQHAKRPHVVCPNCGWYKGRRAVEVD